MITAELLQRLAPRGTNLAAHAAALEAARIEAGVTSRDEVAHVLGQVVVETAGLTALVENLNYRTPAVLLKNFRAVRDVADAQRLIAAGPEAIANRVDAGRLGNGNEASGDGWRYRGSGYKQLTGRVNYRSIGRQVGVDLEGTPEMAREPVAAARVALAFWRANNCGPAAAANNCAAVTRIINGPAMLGLTERRAATDLALRLIA
jgi:putative chitinase